jgi:pimeloyl-ACP methyl ester carboxylesterase
VRLVADDVDGRIVAGSGHWLMEEKPEETSRLLYDFIR